MLAALCAGSIILMDDVRRSHHLASNFPLRIADEQFIPPRYRPAIHYLQSNLEADETILTLTSEASWYYFIDRPAPTRFPVVWFATTEAFQREMVADLPNEKVKYVIYQSTYPMIDQLTHEARYPILMKYLKEQYTPETTLEGVEIWVRTE
jgi:hypothetical protein